MGSSNHTLGPSRAAQLWKAAFFRPVLLSGETNPQDFDFDMEHTSTHNLGETFVASRPTFLRVLP